MSRMGWTGRAPAPNGSQSAWGLVRRRSIAMPQKRKTNHLQIVISARNARPVHTDGPAGEMEGGTPSTRACRSFLTGERCFAARQTAARNRSPSSVHERLHLLQRKFAIFVGVHCLKNSFVSRLKFLQ